jgi:hypothetical protein
LSDRPREGDEFISSATTKRADCPNSARRDHSTFCKTSNKFEGFKLIRG